MNTPEPRLLRVKVVADLPVLWVTLQRLDLPATLDRHFPAPTNWKGPRRPGDVLAVWLLFLVSQGDHGLNHVEPWVAQHRGVLPALRGKSVLLDFIGNKEYNVRMVTYDVLQADRRQFLALTGLTLPEFQRLLSAFPRAYQQVYPASQTTEAKPRQRAAGGGRKGHLHRPEDKLLFILVYLKAYPLQAVMGELFDLSQPQANYWIHRLLPVLQEALDDLGVCPERDASHFAQGQAAAHAAPRLIIDGTERRRQRPKSPEKQALHYSGKKKAHTDKNVVIVTLPRKRVDFLSRTCVGKTHDKKIADTEGITYPPEAILYKDAGFQGYEPAVKETRQAKKKAAPRRTHRR